MTGREGSKTGVEAEKSSREKRFSWITLSAAAFIMSAGATGINVYYALQGSEISVRPPKHILLYRDGVGEDAVLGVALRIQAINTASDYGDLVLGHQLQFEPQGPVFEQEGLASTSFSDDAEAAAGNCSLEMRCVGQNGLVVAQRSDEIMDLAGGAAKAFVPYFWLVRGSCNGSEKPCSAFSNFDAAIDQIGDGPIEFRVFAQLQNDGSREITCRISGIDKSYLKEVGWTQIACESAMVQGEPLF